MAPSIGRRLTLVCWPPHCPLERSWVGVTSQVEVSSHPERMAAARGANPHDRHPLVVYQMFDYLRAFVGTRLAWSRGNYMLCSVGAFAIWRRDVVLELNGFSNTFTCEDIEFTFRVHDYFRRLGVPYRIVSLPDPVGITEAPLTVGRLVSQRARWQRVITETVWAYRHMFLGRRYGTVGWIGMPYSTIVCRCDKAHRVSVRWGFARWCDGADDRRCDWAHRLPVRW